MSMVYTVMLVMANIDGNNNKFWKAEIASDHSVHVTNGRIGATGQVQPVKSFSNYDSAKKFVDSKQSEKLRKGYTLFEGIVEGAASTPTPIKSNALEQIAKREIRTTSDPSVIGDLIASLTRANIHNILQHTDLKYDEGSGLFKTPVGFVTQVTIDEARDLLIKIGNHVVISDFTSDNVKGLVNRYLMLIPQKVGSKLTVQSVFPDQNSLVNQTSILDGLQSSIQQLESTRAASTDTDGVIESNPIKTFNCALSLITDATIIQQIVDKYNSTRQTIHAAHKLKVHRVFAVQIDDMESNYTQHGQALGNVQQLWHGTRIGNVLSILKSGLYIPPANASFVCGRMFGNGAYFSDQSTKSLNYAYGYWDGGSRDNTCYMFLFDVAMGKSYTPSGPSRDLPRPGYDSTFAEARKSGVQNNEMIVYNTYQATPRYLVEFSIY